MTDCAKILTTTNRNGRRRRSRRKRHRRGAALVGTAVTIMVFVAMILGMVDFGILVLRHHVLAQATRQLARRVIVHGDLSTEMGTWGPTTVNIYADDPGEMGTIVRNNLVAINPANVSIQVQWIDAGTSVQAHDRITVTTTAPFQPMLTFLFGNPTFTLTASSTMPIAH